MPRGISLAISVLVLAAALYLAWKLATPDASPAPPAPVAGDPRGPAVPESRTTEPGGLGSGALVPISEAPPPRSDDRIEGRIYDADGAPVSDVEIQIIHFEYLATSTRPPDRRFEERVVTSTVSDATGAYRFTGLAPGEVKNLRASKPGFVTQLKDNVRVPKTTDFHLAAGAYVSGKVVDSATGRPIGNVGVKGWFQSPAGEAGGGARGFRWKEEVFTNRDGAFEFEGVPTGSVLFMLAHPEYLDRSEQRDVVQHARNDLLLSMEPGLSIEGIVLHSKKGSPVPGLEVVAKDNLFLPRWRARTDAAGVFRMIGLRPGPVMFEIAGRGYTPARQAVQLGARNDFSAGKAGQRVEFRIEPAGRVAGRVITSRGGSVDGARIFVAPVPGIFQIVRDPAQHGGSVREGEATTDSDGRFLIDDLTPTPHRLVTVAPGMALAATEGISVGPDEIRENVEIVLRPAPAISGVVTDQLGAPVRGAVITIEIPQYSEVLFPDGFDVGQRGRRELITDTLGRYRLEVPYAGNFRVRVDHEDFVLVDSVEVKLEEDQAEALRDFTLDPGFTIAGVVRGPDGGGAPGVTVRTWPQGGGGPVEVVTGEGGAYVVSRLKAGLYRMHARQPAANLTSEFKDEVPGGATGIDFSLSRGGEVFGVVRDRGGNPVPVYQVWLRPAGRRIPGARERKSSISGLTERQESISDPGGAFRVQGVDPAHWMVQIVSAEHAPSAVVEVTVEPSGQASAGTIVLDTGASVSGRLTGPDGAPAEGVTVHLTRVAGLSDDPGREALLAKTSSARTGPSGEYSLRGLSAGEYHILLEAERFVDPPRERLRLEDGASVDHSITLRAAASVTLQVRDEVSAPAPSVVVVVVDAAGRKLAVAAEGPGSASTDQHGRVTLRKLPAGEPLTLKLIRPGFEVTDVVRTLRAGDNGVVEASVRRLL